MRRHKALVLAACVLIAACVIVALVAVYGWGRKNGEEATKANRRAPATTPSSTTTTTPTQPVSPPSTPTQPAQPGADETAAVTAIALSSAKANNPAIGDLTVVAVKIAGDWARVDLQPTDKSTDIASWLLKKEAGAWRVVDFGTSLMPSNHPDAPAEVFR